MNSVGIDISKGRSTVAVMRPYYNKFWLEAQHPAGLLSISCLSYNKGSNWLTTLFLGFYVRQ